MKEAEGSAGGGAGGGMTMRRNDTERLREMQLSIEASASVFPGFRFSPTDNELISYYLKKKLQGSDNCVDIIPEVDFCHHEPWDLPAISIIRSDNEWFFFSARGKKYPNGSQSRRATQSGYWKATGKERNVKSGVATIGTKRTLVFHTGRAPKGERTEWIMHEYCMSDTTQESLVVCRLRRNGEFRLSESSTRGSNLSTGDNGNSGTQMDQFDEANPMKSCSKESTSSYRSHSAEQNDSESESDQQHIRDSPHGSSSQHKECENNYVDDCFADIMNDDIIKLDESAMASNTLTIFSIHDATKRTQKLTQETMSSCHPLSRQGTAVRRIKLRHQLAKKQHKKASASHRDQEQPSRCVITVMEDAAKTGRWKYMVFVFLSLMILIVAWRGYDVKSSLCVQVSKRQLKFWLHKAANYL